MKYLIFELILTSILAISACSSPKNRYINDLIDFAEQVSTEYENYSYADLDLAIEQYAAFRKEALMYQHEYTEAEMEIINSCNRQINKFLTKHYIEHGINRVEGYIEEAINLIDDLDDVLK